jgi:hypothetical protein
MLIWLGWTNFAPGGVARKNYPLKTIQTNGSFNTSDVIKLNFKFKINNVYVLRHCQLVELKHETKTRHLKFILKPLSNNIKMKSILNEFLKITI